MSEEYHMYLMIYLAYDSMRLTVQHMFFPKRCDFSYGESLMIFLVRFTLYLIQTPNHLFHVYV